MSNVRARKIAQMSDAEVVARAEGRDGKPEPAPISPLFAVLRRLPNMPAWKREMVPWAFGAVEYSERYWSLTRQANLWRNAFFIVLAVLGVVTWQLVVLARTTRVVPYVVQVDRHGYAVGIGPAEKTDGVDERVVLSSVSQWVRSMRTVLADPIAQRALIDTAYAMLSSGTAAIGKADDWYRSHNPLAEKGKHVDVAITKVAPMRSAKAVTVEWTETTRDAGGGQSFARYSAFIEIAITPTQKLDDVLANPLGVFIADYSISQLQ
jgi:type IV secretory pathway TrbF-like protein